MKSSAISIRSSAAGNWQRQSICFGCQKGAVISQLASWLTGIYSWETITLEDHFEYIVYAESRCPKMSLFEGRNEVPVTKKGLFMVPLV